MTLELAHVIDHTLLAPTATGDDIRRLAEEVQTHGFRTACVASRWVRDAFAVLGEHKVCSVVGFPHGNGSTEAKAAETARAVQDGAAEIDVVIALGPAMAGEDGAVSDDLRAVVAAADGRPVKAILETAHFAVPRIEALSKAAMGAGVAFVKTSTGFGPGGATVEAVEAMRRAVGPDLGVKASGGIRSAEDVRRFLDAGATRIGASSGVAILAGGQASGPY